MPAARLENVNMLPLIWNKKDEFIIHVLEKKKKREDNNKKINFKKN